MNHEKSTRMVNPKIRPILMPVMWRERQQGSFLLSARALGSCFGMRL
jgi:hypothetical protein